MTETKQFIYLDVSEKPLQRVEDAEILKRIIDPTTNKPYDGLIFSGEFASLGVLNNNNRIYDEPNYLEFVVALKKVIFGTRGLYGHLEHGKGYANDYNKVSHKILDIWYDKPTKKVYGTIMLLNTPKGRIPREIYRSGGRFAISGRGGGTEIKNADGTFTAILKLLVTFDIVYHPGFTTSEQIGVTLNESIQNNNISLEKMQELYESYAGIPLQERGEFDFKSWSLEKLNKEYEMKQLNESQQSTAQEKQDIQILEKSDAPNQQESEKDLENAVDQQLSQSQIDFRKQKNKSFAFLGSSLFDGSAGFVENGFSE